VSGFGLIISKNRRTTINLGIGHRLLVEDDMAIVGINVFTDYETKSRLRPAPNAFKNALALSLTKPSVLLMAWFCIGHRLLVEDDMAIVGINVLYCCFLDRTRNLPMG
jgi:hypothetical protein